MQTRRGILLDKIFASLRAANLADLRAVGPDVWDRVGTANRAQVSVRALAFILAGHVRHHCDILTSRYKVPRAPAATPSWGHVNPKRGVSVSSRWGVGPQRQ